MVDVSDDIIVVGESDEGMRLDRFLCTRDIRDDNGDVLSRNAISRAIARGAVRVNDHVVKPHYAVRHGDGIAIARHVRIVTTNLTPCANIAFETLFENKDFIIVNKPAGLVVHPAQCGDKSNTLVHGLIAHYPEIVGIGDDVTRPGIVHRLDRDTSGVMIIARTAEAFATLKVRFKERAMHKTYYAIVHGIPKNTTDVIDFPIARSIRSDRWIALRTQRDPYKGIARTAHTAYRTVYCNGTMSLLRVMPTTGRTHQIRVHMQAIGYPIVGDPLYKIRGVQNSGIARQALHAAVLHFSYHGRQWAFSAPLPEDMNALMTIQSSKLCKT